MSGEGGYFGEEAARVCERDRETSLCTLGLVSGYVEETWSFILTLQKLPAASDLAFCGSFLSFHSGASYLELFLRAEENIRLLQRLNGRCSHQGSNLGCKPVLLRYLPACDTFAGEACQLVKTHVLLRLLPRSGKESEETFWE